MKVLDKINSANDVKQLNQDELDVLCSELRSLIIDTVSQNGGHLSSNLGSVELTVAIHRVFDTSKDRILFDVGHQCYTHKILTGRKDSFKTLRQYGGIAGFPKPFESDDDAFIAGHASDSVSAALGMAKARTLLNKEYKVVAVIGDGALTGGLAYEGLVNAASSNEPLIVILNDNNMSISKNDGGTSNFLQRLRVKRSYINFKRHFRELVGTDSSAYRFVHNTKEHLKSRLLPSNVFVDMGFDYLGPVDGHDISELENVLSLASEIKGPVLVHVLTVKGKGCSYAEENPEKYHGVGRFNPITGELAEKDISFSNVFGQSLCNIASKDNRVVAITAAMTSGTGLEVFKEMFPNRFFDVGIAEGHAVAEGAAMAKQGLIPVIAVYSTFLQRAFDMMIHDVSLLNLHVVFAVDRAGLVGSDGETHHGLFDISYLSSVPNMTIFSPSNFSELDYYLNKAVFDVDGPVAIRFPRGTESKLISSDVYNDEVKIRDGDFVTMVGYGTEIDELCAAADILSSRGISVDLVKLNVLKPNKFPVVMDSLRKTGRLFIAEDACASGCIGFKILTIAAKNEIHIHSADLVNLGEGIVPHGDVFLLKKDYSLDSESIADRIFKTYGEDKT